MSTITHYALRRQYKMGNNEIKFIESLPKLEGGEQKIEYTPSQKRQMQAICARMTDMNGNTEWHWMLKGANTTDFKTTKANAMHIYLLAVSKLKWELSFPEAAYEFHYALWESHVWYRKLLHNAYTFA